MYNSEFNYYIKGLLGKKNDAWYFDNLEKSFKKSNRKLTNDILDWVQNGNKDDNNLINNGFTLNPLYPIAEKLRDDLLSEFENKYKDRNLQILLHTPPSNFSPGGFSWFHNLGAALTFCGIDVIYFWDDLEMIELDISKRIIIFTGLGDHYLKCVNLDWLKEKQKKYQIDIGYAFPYNFNKNDVAPFFEKYLNVENSFFYSYHNIKSFSSSDTFKYFKQHHKTVLTLEFAANPLYHFPTKYIKTDIDYVFLGSTNWDKARRYSQFFNPFFKSNYKGMVAGPGWDWIEKYPFNVANDTYIYSRAKIALNLHIDSQITLPTELNERAYLLAACGIPQLTDNAALINIEFSSIGMIADSNETYFELFDRYVNDSKKLKQFAIGAIHELYSKHTTFHRTENLITALSLK